MKQIHYIIIFNLIILSAVIYAQSPTIEWYKLYNGIAGYCVEQTSDSGYIIVGEVWGAGSQDLHLIKTNSIGDTIWTRRYEGANINSNGYSVHQAFDGGFVAAGVYADLLYIVKTNNTGDSLVNALLLMAESGILDGVTPEWACRSARSPAVDQSGRSWS